MIYIKHSGQTLAWRSCTNKRLSYLLVSMSQDKESPAQARDREGHYSLKHVTSHILVSQFQFNYCVTFQHFSFLSPEIKSLSRWSKFFQLQSIIYTRDPQNVKCFASGHHESRFLAPWVRQKQVYSSENAKHSTYSYIIIYYNCSIIFHTTVPCSSIKYS